MLGWLQRFLVKPPPGVRPLRAHTLPAAAKAPRVAASQSGRPVDAGDATSMEAYLLVLGADLSLATQPDAMEPDSADEELAALVVDHFLKNRPGPSLAPKQAMQIIHLVANPDVELQQLAHVIQADAALSAGVLKAANSAAVRGAQEVETVRDAITRLGLEEVGRIAGALSARTLFSPRAKAEHAAFAGLWTSLFHASAAQGMACAELAMRTKGARSDRVFLGGMMHDIGKVVGLRSLTSLYLQRKVDGSITPRRVASILDMVHGEIGEAVHLEWELPGHLHVMCKRHHAEHLPGGPDMVDLHIVRLISALQDLEDGAEWESRSISEASSSARALSMLPNAVRATRSDLRATLQRTSFMFKS